MLPLQIGHGHLNGKLIGHPIVHIERIGLGDRSGLLMMVQDQPLIGLVRRRDNTVGATQQSHGGVVVHAIDRQHACLRHLLLRPNHDKTRHGAAGGLCRVDAWPQEKDECKTENESEYESFPCHDDVGPYLSRRIVPIRLSYNPLSGSRERRNAALL